MRKITEKTSPRGGRTLLGCLAVLALLVAQIPSIGQDSLESSEQESYATRAADVLSMRVLEFLTWGPPLEAKLRQRVWAAGREVVEVGHYEQAGGGTGRVRMELQVPIADGKGRWQQTCDGRLAWTREELAGEVRVRRVDVGRLDEFLPPDVKPRVTPRLRVGGLAEIIDRIRAEYQLTLSEGHIEGAPMLVIKGTMKPEIVEAIDAAGEGEFSVLVPRQVRIAVPADSLQAPLPSRIEFWTEPGGRLISLLEIYDSTTIEPPPLDRFRFEVGLDEVTNETEMYLERFGLLPTEPTPAAGPVALRAR